MTSPVVPLVIEESLIIKYVVPNTLTQYVILDAVFSKPISSILQNCTLPESEVDSLPTLNTSTSLAEDIS